MLSNAMRLFINLLGRTKPCGVLVPVLAALPLESNAPERPSVLDVAVD
jgi:hypothetical protein